MQTEVKTYEMTAEAIKTYAFRLDDDGNILEEINDPLDTEGMLARALSGGGGGQTLPSQEIHNRAVAYTHNHPEVDYRRAVDIVMSDDPRLVRAYAGEHGNRPRVYSADAHPGNDPAEEIHQKAVSLLDQEICSTYSEAAAKVLRMNPRLQERWSQYASCGR